MVTLTQQEVERRLGTVPCAICKESSFGIDERFKGTDGEWRGICKKCYYTFPVHADMEFYLRTQPDVPYRSGSQSGFPSHDVRARRLLFRDVPNLQAAVPGEVVAGGL
jgi:hypothetical protein